MQDDELFRHLIKAIKDGLARFDITDIPVLQDYQPTNQGAEPDKAVYVDKILGDRRVGFPGKKQVWDEDEQRMVKTVTQCMESTFQISTQWEQNPKTPSMTASDLANLVAFALAEDETIDQFAKLGLEVLRITDVRNPYFKNDKSRFEASPSFDFTLTHNQVIISASPVVEKVDYNINRV